jgi:hypothetical protein
MRSGHETQETGPIRVQMRVQECMVRAIRGHIRYGRGDTAGALHDAEKGVAAGRAQFPQALVYGLSFAAWLMQRTGRRAEANRLLDDLATLPRTPEEVTARVDSVMAFDVLGRRADIERVAASTPPGAWADLFTAAAEGRFADAADAAVELGTLPEAALLRWRAAERLLAAGRAADARVQLAKAGEFWRAVGATHHIREAEDLLAHPAAPAARSGGRAVRRRLPRRS